VAESCTICSSRSRRPVRQLLVTPSYIKWYQYTVNLKMNRQIMVKVKLTLGLNKYRAVNKYPETH